MVHWFETQLFAPTFGALAWPRLDSHAGWLGFQSHDTGDAVVYMLAVPGYRKKDLVIEVRDRHLTVAGERREGLFSPSARHSFVRSFTLPAWLDSSDVVADLRDGILSLTAAKRHDARSRCIPVGGVSHSLQLPASSSPSLWQRFTLWLRNSIASARAPAASRG